MGMFKIFKKAILAGLGFQALANETVQAWIKEGERNQRKEAVWVKELMARLEKDTESADQKIKELYKKACSLVNLPSREELDRLSKKVDDLVARYEHTQRAQSPSIPAQPLPARPAGAGGRQPGPTEKRD
jgi:polyhydroxyalkanoate synthesis regulator phasin